MNCSRRTFTGRCCPVWIEVPEIHDLVKEEPKQVARRGGLKKRPREESPMFTIELDGSDVEEVESPPLKHPRLRSPDPPTPPRAPAYFPPSTDRRVRNRSHQRTPPPPTAPRAHKRPRAFTLPLPKYREGRPRGQWYPRWNEGVE